MNNTNSTIGLIQDWVLQHFPLAQQRSIDADDSLLDSGIVDSLGTLDVVMHLESKFGIAVSDDEMVADHFESIRSIATYVDRKLAECGQEPIEV